jgi:hypothetical protein
MQIADRIKQTKTNYIQHLKEIRFSVLRIFFFIKLVNYFKITNL